MSIPTIGCCPVSRLRNNGSCDELMNDSAQSFLIGLQGILEILQTEYIGFQYSIGNSYLMTQSIISNPLTFRKYKSQFGPKVHSKVVNINIYRQFSSPLIGFADLL